MFIPSKIIPSEIQRDLNVQTKDETSKPKTFGQVLLDRSDTLRSAGFYDVNINEESSGSGASNNQYPPLTAGAKTNITLFLVALGYKYYRSIFINKVSQSVSRSVGRSNACKFPNYGFFYRTL